MVNMGLSDNVTAFTISDFGRTLTCNSNGTDHGWGSHHFVVGGAVQGQDMYGQYPVVGVNQANDVGERPPDPHHVGRAIRRNAGALVRPLRQPDPHRLPQLRQLRFEPLSGLHGLTAHSQR